MNKCGRIEIRKNIDGKKWKESPVLGEINMIGELEAFCEQRGLKVTDVRVMEI